MSERRRKRFVPSLPLDLFSSAVVPPASPMPPPRAVPDAVWRATVRRRIWVGAVLAALWTGAIEARLVYLQVLAHDDLVARAERQQMRTITVPAKRGEILD